MSDSKLLPEVMRDVIQSTLHVHTNDRNILVIEEKNKESVCKQVEIRLKKSISCFAFSIDKNREKGQSDPIYPFFNEKIECIGSKNDAVFCIQHATQIYILLLELKSKNTTGYLDQLLAAKGLVEFIVHRIRLCYLSINNINNIIFKGILFSCRCVPDEGLTKKQQCIDFKEKHGLLVTEQHCDTIYHIKQFIDL